jgi:hypothetical protein
MHAWVLLLGGQEGELKENNINAGGMEISGSG